MNMQVARPDGGHVQPCDRREENVGEWPWSAWLLARGALNALQMVPSCFIYVKARSEGRIGDVDRAR